MLQQKQFTEPKISPESHDMSVDWYVWFRFFHEGKWWQKRYKAGINHFKTLKERLSEANSLKRVLKEQLAEGWNPVTEVKVAQVVKIYTIKDSFDHILKVKSKTLRPKSCYAYTYISKLFLGWCEDRYLLDAPLSAFTNKMAQEYMDYLTMQKSYEGRTFNDHLIVLRTLFNCFIKREAISKNPFKAVDWKPENVGRNLAFLQDEEEKLKDYLYKFEKRLYYFTQIMYYCFIRRTEMVAMKIKHIDLKNGTITIPAQSSKNKSQESVVIPRGLEPILLEMELYKYNSEDYLFGRKLQTGSVKFKNPNHITSKHSEIARRLNIDTEKGLYSWKHTGVCKAYYATGKDIYSVMRQLRHRDINTTMIYLKSLGLIQNDVFKNAMTA